MGKYKKILLNEEVIMSEELNNMDVWKDRVQQDLNELKSNQSQMDHNISNLKSDVSKLQISDQLQNQEIKTLKDALNDIKEDTNWIRRKITGAIITATITAVVAGIIGIAIANIF